jgi:fructose-bisphosphate aldolase class II
MELIQGITEAANELKLPIILQVSNGARKYANPIYLRKLVEAACEATDIPIALHLDHGDSFEVCKDCIDGGFTSVMIDGSSLPFAENIALTKRVVDYAIEYGKKHGIEAPSVEGELGELAGIEDDVSNEESHYTDPKTVREFVDKTGVTSLAISIGTSHGAHKYKAGSDPELALDLLAEIHAEIPDTALVLHGASSVVPEAVTTINTHGGNIVDAMGMAEIKLAKTISLGVRKINIDSDLRLVFTAAIRKHLAENPSHFDPRQYLKPARDAIRALVTKKLEIFTK